MAAGGVIPDLALGAGERVGRYFNLVSLLPSSFLVFFTYALIASGAWSGPPDWSSAFDALAGLSFGVLSTLVFLAFVVAAALHPLQFAITQVFEGYWGSGPAGQRAALAMVHRHRRIYFRLVDSLDAAGVVLQDAPPYEAGGRRRPQDVAHILREAEAARLLDGYPIEASRILPTRLGNALRRGEDVAGRPYGLPAVAVTPQLALVAPPEHVAYLDDQRTQLDSAIRFALVCLIATGLSVTFLWSDGAWLLVGLVSYLLAYLSYRGAVVVAGEYGAALSTLVALNRFALYERHHLPHPASAEEERDQNASFTELLLGSRLFSADYAAPGAPADPVPPWWYVLGRRAAGSLLSRLRGRVAD